LYASHTFASEDIPCQQGSATGAAVYVKTLLFKKVTISNVYVTNEVDYDI